MIDFIKRLLFVRKCLLCGEVLTDSKENVFCQKCRLKYEKEKRHLCRICGKAQVACGCLPEKLHHEVSWTAHLLAYGDTISQTIIFSLKRRDFVPLHSFLGSELASLLGDVSGWDITFAPRKPKSVREYGFDQAEALASAISEKKELPMVKLFSHARRSKLQKGLDAKARAENAEKSYMLCKAFVRQNEKLIIVDDVMTTGSTLARLVYLAKSAGYTEVAVICVAKTTHEKETR